MDEPGQVPAFKGLRLQWSKMGKNNEASKCTVCHVLANRMKKKRQSTEMGTDGCQGRSSDKVICDQSLERSEGEEGSRQRDGKCKDRSHPTSSSPSEGHNGLFRTHSPAVNPKS